MGYFLGIMRPCCPDGPDIWKARCPIVKTIKATSIALLSIVVLVSLAIGWFVYVTEYRTTDIDASSSPSGRYQAVFQAVGEPDFPFGSSHAKIVVKDGADILAVERLDVANDGGVLHPENWSVAWEDGCVRVVVSGEEQDDALYTFDLPE